MFKAKINYLFECFKLKCKNCSLEYNSNDKNKYILNINGKQLKFEKSYCVYIFLKYFLSLINDGIIEIKEK